MRIKEPIMIAAVGSSIAMFSTAVDAAEFQLGKGWTGNVGLLIQGFYTSVDDKVNDRKSTRVQTGFDPSKLTLSLAAPEHNGIKASATYQLVQSINGDGVTGDDSAQREVRIAEAAIAGDFGKITVGRTLGIFGTQALIHDTGSIPGIGWGAGGGGGTLGRIDFGYNWASFHGGVKYDSNDLSGFSFSLGAFDPRGVGSDDVRFQGGLNYKTKNYDLWTSFSHADGGNDTEISGYDIGGEARFGKFAVTANYTDGTGIACCNTPSNDDFEHWFVEADYTVGKTTYGISYGENELTDQAGALKSEGDLLMAFVHHKLTPQLTLIGEYNTHQIDDASGVAITDVDTLGIGVHYQF